MTFDAATIAAGVAAVGSPVVAVAVLKSTVKAIQERMKEDRQNAKEDRDKLEKRIMAEIAETRAAKADKAQIEELLRRIDKLEAHMDGILNTILQELRRNP